MRARATTTTRPATVRPDATQLTFDLAKRWSARRQRWVAPDRVFRPDGYAVDLLDYTPAKAFVVGEHYAGSMPPTYESVGLWRSTGGTGSELVGVAVFSVPTSIESPDKWFGVPFAQACDLGRFVLRETVAFNGETWFLTRALRLLRRARPEFQGIISYADPREWQHGAEVTKPAHFGCIYASANATYVGRSTPRTLHVTQDGRPLNARNLQKIRAEERGWEYAAQQLLDAGAVGRERHESLAAWVDRALATPGFTTRVRHHGNHTYLFPLSEAVRRTATDRHVALPWPKAERDRHRAATPRAA